MAVSAKEVSQRVIDSIRINKLKMATIPWDELYKLSGRKRLREAFLNKLGRELAGRNYLLCCGNQIVAVLPDTNFEPLGESAK